MQEEVLFPILELRKEFNGFLKKTKNSDFNNVNEDLPLVFDNTVQLLAILMLFENEYSSLNNCNKDINVCGQLKGSQKTFHQFFHGILCEDPLPTPNSFIEWFRSLRIDMPFSSQRQLSINARMNESTISMFNEFYIKLLSIFENADATDEHEHGTISKSKTTNKQYQFSPAFLEEYFEETLESDSKKSTGAVYTPNHIAEHIIDNLINHRFMLDTGKTSENGVKNRPNLSVDDFVELGVLDPCCGCGTFVISYIKSIIKWAKINRSSSEGTLRKLQQIITTNIHAFDLSQYALNITKIRVILIGYSCGAFNKETLAETLLKNNYIKINPLIYHSNPQLYHSQKKNQRSKKIPESDIITIRISKNDSYDPDFGQKFQKSMPFLRDIYDEKGDIIPVSEHKAVLDAFGLNGILDQTLNKRQNQTAGLDRFIKQNQNKSKKSSQKEEASQKMGQLNPAESIYVDFLIEKESLDLLFPLYANDDLKNLQFDLIFGNPPYVRADNQDLDYKSIRRLIKSLYCADPKSDYLKMKWDLYIAFLIMGIKIKLKPGGELGFIISDSFGYSDSSEMLRKEIIESYTVTELDFFSSKKVFKNALVSPMILFIKNIQPDDQNQITIKHFSKETLERPEIHNKRQKDSNFKDVFRIESLEQAKEFESLYEFEEIDNICYISVGIVANAHEITAKSEFVKKDLIHDKPIPLSRKYLEGKNLECYGIKKYRYIEWGTERSPGKLRRATFPELYSGKKIIIGTMADGTIETENAVVNHSVVVFRLWKDLEGVNNNSIKIKDRKHLEMISQEYSYEYILAILNSKLIKEYLNTIRVSTLNKHIQPNDFRKIPIPKLKDQTHYSVLVQAITSFPNIIDSTDKSMKNKVIDILDAAIFELFYSKKVGIEFNKLLAEKLKDIDINEPDLNTGQTLPQVYAIIKDLKVPEFK